MALRKPHLSRFVPVLLSIIALWTTTALTMPPTAAPVVAQDGDFKVVQSADGLVSIRIPVDWDVIDVLADEGFMVYGGSEEARTGRLNDYRGEPALLVGEGGTITPLNVTDFGLTEAGPDVLTGVLDSVLTEIINNGGQVLEEATEIEFDGGRLGFMAVILAGNEQGFIGAVGFDSYAVLLSATGTRQSFEANRDLMRQILTSVQVPAEAGTTATDTADAESDANLVRSSDGRASIILPEGWGFNDQLATNNILAFGDSETGANSRLEVALADDPSQITISDNGGIVRLFSLDELGIDPNNPDVGPLMNQLTNVFRDDGTEIIAEATDFTAGDGQTGIYIVFDSGAQYGYTVLIPYADAVVFMTASSTDAEGFAAVQDLLFSVVESVRVPAAEPGSDDAGSGTGRFPGLGGGTPGVALPDSISSPDGLLTLNIPEGWATSVDTSDEDFKVLLYFAETPDAIDVIRNGLNPDEPSGIVFVLEAGSFPAETDIDVLFDDIAPDTADLDKKLAGEINGADVRWVTYMLDEGTENAYEAYYVLLHMPTDEWVLVVAGSAPENFEDTKPILEGIFKSATSPESTSGNLGSSGSK